MELLPVKAEDSRGLLTAVLKGVKAKGNHRRRLRRAPDAEHAALFVQLVIVERVCRKLACPNIVSRFCHGVLPVL
jgi:hypothetical protein